MKSGARILLAAALLSVPLALAGQVTQKTITEEADLPYVFAPGWKPGDLFLTDGRYLILFGGSERPLRSTLNSLVADGKGGILGFVPAGLGLDANLNIGCPVVRRGSQAIYPTCSDLHVFEEGGPGKETSLEATAEYVGKDGERAGIRTVYKILPGTGRIDIRSVITNTGRAEIRDIGYSLFFGAASAYSFAPFAGLEGPERNFRVVQKKGLSLGWLDPNPKPSGERRPPENLAPGKSYEVRYSLFAASGPQSLLERIYAALGLESTSVLFELKGIPGDLGELVVRDALTDAVFFRSFLRKIPACAVPLPAGTYKVTANLFPSVVETLISVDGKPGTGECVLTAPPVGTLKLRLVDGQGKYVPGKATIIGLSPTRDPYLAPDDPTETGRNWETSKRSCYPGPDGLDIAVPAGTYVVSASRGPEFTVEQAVVEVLQGGTVSREFRLERMIDPRGFVSVDPHLHTTESDGRTGIPERLRSIVAEGVDVAVATDHNVVTDYGPWLTKLGLGPWLAVIPGTEVTPPDFYIHFNIFPLSLTPPAGPKGPVVPLEGSVADLFAAARKKAPAALIQVNHPRLEDLGYFNNSRLDEKTAGAAASNFSTEFDLLEVMNGPAYFSRNDEAVEDWFHLLNRGFYYPITGSSDSHSADGGEPGFSRVYVRYGGEKGDKLDWGAVARALKAGRSFVTNGPFVNFEVDGRYSSGDLVTRKSGKIVVEVSVQAAPWISVDEVRIIVNGERKIVRPVRGGRRSAPRFEEKIPLVLLRDSSIVVEVLGGETLFPVVLAEGSDGTKDQAALPYALTNPLFVDVDGNGRFDAPLPRKIGVLPAEIREVGEKKPAGGER
jgi:hypothetical protein